MTQSELYSEHSRTHSVLFIPSVAFSTFAIQSLFMIVGLLLIDIAGTLNHPVGVMGQIQTAASLVGAVGAILMGAWSVRFNHKSLLLSGLLIYCISAVGCFLAVNFLMMLLAYALAGFAIVLVLPMAYALIGEHLPLEKRAGAIGVITAGIALSSIIGAPIISFIAGLRNWRWAIIGYALPIALFGLVIAAKGIPASSKPITKKHEQYWDGFKDIFSASSAIACLIASAFSTVSWQALVVWGASFFRYKFQISLGFVAVLYILSAICYIVGNLIASQLVNRFGRRPVTVLSAILAGIATIAYMNMPSLLLAIFFGGLAGLFSGMLITTSLSLTLEQVPKYRGSMMSLNSASSRMGEAIGAGIGGIALLLYGYGAIGAALGVMNIAAGIIFLFFVIDPTRP